MIARAVGFTDRVHVIFLDCMYSDLAFVTAQHANLN